MPNYKPITPSWPKRWNRIKDWHHASDVTLASLVATELVRASTSLPIGFCRGESLYPCAILGFRPKDNYFVSPDGRWIGPYIPACFRSYPFALTKVQPDGYLLCADTDSDLIGAEHDLPFYDANGELSQPVKEVLDFLLQVERNRAATLRVCAALDAEGLIVPWEITVHGQDGPTKINDLFRIDEAKLNSLNPAALARLHQAGALPVAYCQLISMQHIHTLAKLADAHAKIEAAQPQPEKPNGQSGVSFLGDDGKIDFSGLR